MSDNSEFQAEEHLFEHQDNDGDGESSVTFQIDSFYNKDEDPQVKQALIDMGFGGLHSFFKNAYIDFEAFRQMNSRHISDILNQVPVGLTIKFQSAYNKWKENLPPTSTTTTNLKNDGLIKISPGIIKRLLKESTDGAILVKASEEERSFTEAEKNLLMKLVLAPFFDRKQQLTSQQIIQLAKAIQLEFPQEQATSYINLETGAGCFYNKYNYTLKKLRANQLMPRSTSASKRKPDETPLVLEFTDDEVRSDEFVKSCSIGLDFNAIIAHWRNSHRYRMNFFKNSPPEIDIIQPYAILQRPDGHLFIANDFDQLFPSHINLRDQWYLFEQKLAALVKVTTQEDLTNNQRIGTVIRGLHNRLFAPKTFKASNNFEYRPTSPDTLAFMIFVCETEDSMDEKLQEFRQSMFPFGLQHQAVIVGFGNDVIDLQDKFIVKTQDLKYIFQGQDSILSALDCLLKIYFVFNLTYPAVSQNVYEFLTTKYLGVSNEADYGKKQRKGNQVSELINLM